MTHPNILISICICTYKRPVLLERLLHALHLQRTNNLPVEIIVVDNDPARSAHTILHSWHEQAGITLRAFHEPVPNIALARNLAIRHARGDWLLCIDDDETPEEDWLINMMHTQHTLDADVVFGPVLPRYAEGTPAWLRKGGFFERRRFPTGTPVGKQDARTSNVLIRRSILSDIPGPFDSAFGRTGAEDTVLFEQLIARQYNLVWCDEAAVSEEVPPDRANAGWLLRRSYRMGQTYMHSEMVTRKGIRCLWRAAFLGARAVLQLGIACVITLLSLPLSRITAMRWLRITCAQCGKLSALAGHRYHAYGN